MSFYSSTKLDKYPGVINGNAMQGLCERVCIQTNKVFDACMSQVQESNVTITITNPTPSNPVEPLTFVSLAGSQEFATITNLVVDRFEDKPNFARVSCNVEIPVVVTYTDANGVTGTGEATIVVPKDVILYVPQASIIPYSINAFGAVVSPDGTYTGNLTFNVTCCTTVILRVVVNAELLVPSYGYCPLPPCQEYAPDQCQGFFNLPLYPNQTPLVNGRR